MPVTITPLGMLCNLQCDYCYEEPQRLAGNAGGHYDVDRIKQSVAAIDPARKPFLLFGGEPLLLPKPVLEDLWAWGHARSGRSTVQTNGALIDADHLALFKKYQVSVGVSLDGPGALNDARRDRTLEKTREATARTEAAISLLCAEGIPPSLIVTLHRLNATGPALQQLVDWFHRLQGLGVRRVGLHLLEVEDEATRRAYEMTTEECADAVFRLRGARSELPGMTFTLLDDLDNLLRGRDGQAKCIWQACDPYTTPAVVGVGGHGELAKCSRVNKDGVDFVPASTLGFQRYVALYQTPREAGGCSGCRFFLMCRAQCPGTAIDGDWRNRSEQCETWTHIFETIEGELLGAGEVPLSVSPERTRIERELLRTWESGRNVPVQSILRRLAHKGGRVDAGADPEPFASPSPTPEALPFRLAPFSRVSWTSTEAREAWEPRLAEIRRAVTRTEWMAVAAGLRDVALATVPIEGSPDQFAVWQSRDLAWAQLSIGPDRRMQLWNAGRGDTSGPTATFAVARAPVLQQFLGAWMADDHGAVADHLGYPACCSGAARDIVVRAAGTDTIWAMALADAARPSSDLLVRVEGSRATNILFGALGVRAVPHRPCSFHCHATAQVAESLRRLSTRHFPEDAAAYADLDALLAWPAEWSGLHGIAEVKSPLLNLCTNTDATAHKHVVQWVGDGYPAEGAQGLIFPYRSKARRLPLLPKRGTA
jgi:uncharacterized protein